MHVTVHIIRSNLPVQNNMYEICKTTVKRMVFWLRSVKMLKIMEYYLLARQFFYAPFWQTMEPCYNSHNFSLDINLDVEQNSSSSCWVPFFNIFPLYLPKICIKHINVGDKPQVAVAKRFIEAWINNQGDERWSFNARAYVQVKTMRRHVR